MAALSIEPEPEPAPPPPPATQGFSAVVLYDYEVCAFPRHLFNAC